MRHRKANNNLRRKTGHRKSMLANMSCSLIMHKRIKTTLAKAKVLKRFVEPIITKSKNANSNGMISMEELTEISIPAGVSEGMQLKVKEKGNHAPFGGIPGDLLVLIEEERHTELIREGKNLHYDLYISISDAVIGCQVEIPTINGKAKINIQSGVQSGKILRLRSKGLSDIELGHKGDLLVHINVWTPNSLNKEQKKFFTEQSNAKEFRPQPKNQKSFFEKVKEMFN